MLQTIPHLTPLPAQTAAVLRPQQWQATTLDDQADPLKTPANANWLKWDLSKAPDIGGLYARSPQVVAKTTIVVPQSWAGQRIKLRRYGGQPLVNGQVVKPRDELLPPFEEDITAQVKTGQPNELTLVWKNEKINDLIAKLEEVAVFAVPDNHLAYLYFTPQFDKAYRNATLSVRTAVTAQGATALPAGTMRVELLDPKGQPVPGIAPQSIATPPVAAGQTAPIEFALAIPAPLQWHPEHPFLYTLRLTLGGEVVTERVGFRQFEIRGNRVFLNGKPHKLRGVHMSMLLNVAGDPRDGELSPPPHRLAREALENACARPTSTRCAWARANGRASPR